MVIGPHLRAIKVYICIYHQQLNVLKVVEIQVHDAALSKRPKGIVA